MDELRNSKQDKVSFGYYLVALIDILGQRQALRNLKELPGSQEEYEHFIRLVKETFGVVLGTRQMLKNFYDAFIEPTALAKALSIADRQKYDDFRRTNLRFQQFSDTVITYFALNETTTPAPINSLYATIMACGTTMLCSLAANHPIRGAIEIGVGAEVFEGEIYGSCLQNAYEIERDIAQYPRIVVGDQTIDYLNHKKNKLEADPKSTYERGLASICLSVLCLDADNHVIVDYLGDGFTRVVKHSHLDDDLIPKAFEFVNNQFKRWQQEKNSKLTSRYNLLHQYFLARSVLWRSQTNM